MMDSKQVLARFDAERQSLALMDHPNIAKVLDGGLLAGSTPFSAKELQQKGLLEILRVVREEEPLRPSTRLSTANGFAADVLRYLAGEPVQTHPPSGAYRLNTFVRRNRVKVMAGTAVPLALVAGVIGTSWQAIQAERERAGEPPPLH